MTSTRKRIEKQLNRWGATLLGGRTSRTVVAPYRIGRIRSLPDDFSYLGTNLDRPFEVDLDRITTIAGFTYQRGGWSPYLSTLDEVLSNPDIPYEETTLFMYYELFKPQTAQDVLLPLVEYPVFPLGEWGPWSELIMHPWSMTRRYLRAVDSKGRNDRRQEIGPQSVTSGRAHMARVLSVYYSISEDGFRPDEYRDGLLRGYFLVRGDDFRFMILHGNHRLAALRRLDITSIPVRIDQRHPPVVNESELHRRPRGERAVLGDDAAAILFKSQFESTGRERALALGLIPSERG